VDPSSVTTWRQERLALAEPLAAENGTTRYRIDNITGTDVRNMEDENLGSVSDVIIDPESGTAAYVIVARGGFLGMGEDHYAIPWDEVRATPGLEMIVVNRTAAELDEAPAVDPDRFRNPEMRMDERRTTDEFWTQRG
jgi:sporulation protein YlmC with PRC-barrel domain